VIVLIEAQRHWGTLFWRRGHGTPLKHTASRLQKVSFFRIGSLVTMWAAFASNSLSLSSIEARRASIVPMTVSLRALHSARTSLPMNARMQLAIITARFCTPSNSTLEEPSQILL